MLNYFYTIFYISISFEIGSRMSLAMQLNEISIGSPLRPPVSDSVGNKNCNPVRIDPIC